MLLSFFQHSICTLLSFSMSVTFLLFDFLSVNISNLFLLFGRPYTRVSKDIILKSVFKFTLSYVPEVKQITFLHVPVSWFRIKEMV